MATQFAETTEQLWERWPTLSHVERLNEFRQMHTAEKAEFFHQLTARDQSDLLLRLPKPFVATVVDVTGLVIYFSIAKAIMLRPH